MSGLLKATPVITATVRDFDFQHISTYFDGLSSAQLATFPCQSSEEEINEAPLDYQHSLVWKGLVINLTF